MLAPSAKAALTDVNRDGFADLVLSLFGVSINSLLTTSAVFLSEGGSRFSRGACAPPMAARLRTVSSASLDALCATTNSTSSILTETVWWTC